ncbi:UNVERIFIED_CONTAM: Proline-rich protein 5 [Trichonephila clavipes]
MQIIFSDNIALENFVMKMLIYLGPELLNSLEEVWTSFYSDTLPLLEGAFYLLKPRGRLSVRGIALAAFRDIVFFAEDVEGTKI